MAKRDLTAGPYVVEPTTAFVLELSAVDRLLLVELLSVAQSHLLEVAATADARKLVNPALPPKLRGWAARCAGFMARLQAGA